MSNPARAYPGRLPSFAERNAGVLTANDLSLVNALLRDCAPGWSADLNQSGPDEATIVVMPEAANDLLGPAFVLHRGNGRVRLDQFRWDEYRKLGGFGSLDDALASLRTRLAAFVLKGAPRRFD